MLARVFGVGSEGTTDHRGVTTVPVTVSFEARSQRLHLSIGTLDLERVLEEDDIGFSVLELTFLLQQCREGTHDGVSLSDFLGREKTELSALGREDLELVLGERRQSSELGQDRPEVIVSLDSCMTGDNFLLTLRQR
jgi:hypothetical protein